MKLSEYHPEHHLERAFQPCHRSISNFKRVSSSSLSRQRRNMIILLDIPVTFVGRQQLVYFLKCARSLLVQNHRLLPVRVVLFTWSSYRDSPPKFRCYGCFIQTGIPFRQLNVTVSLSLSIRTDSHLSFSTVALYNHLHYL